MKEKLKLQKTPGMTEIKTISTQTHAKKERKKKTTTSRTTEKTKKTENNKNNSSISNNRKQNETQIKGNKATERA
jgi:hypothetical protein